MSSGTADIGSTRPLCTEQSGHPVESVDGLAEQLPEGDDEQVADRVVVQFAVAVEAMLQDVGPGPAPLVVAAQRGQRHPQVARRQHAELAPQPARRTAVVGDRHDGGQLVRDLAQGGQRGGQAVPATQCDDAWSP